MKKPALTQGSAKTPQVGMRSVKALSRSKCVFSHHVFLVLKTKCRLLYPAKFKVPDDSDYDDQEDFDPVETLVMPLALQDMKLRRDYTNLPDFEYVSLAFCLSCACP